MEATKTQELQGQLKTSLVVRYGSGTGVRACQQEEVVHLSLQVMACGSEGLVESQDRFEPYRFHGSRRCGLELATLKLSEIASLGYGGPAVALRIPAIPWAQEQDAGLHITLYDQPKQEMACYTPPDLEKCRALEGSTFTLCMDGTLKILNGNELNDFKVGGCYYVSLGCGPEATSIANDIKSKVGLSPNHTQEFHLSLATLAPEWLPCHPRSAVALTATDEQKSVWQDMLVKFRHGDVDVGFDGFNDNVTTGWTTNAQEMKQAGEFNASIMAQIKNLTASDVEKQEKLQQQLIDVQKTIGFCKPVGSMEAIQSINLPDTDSQIAMKSKFEKLQT